MKLVEIVRVRIDFSYCQDWSTQGDQRLQSSGYLQTLQRLTEISEFIDFMSSSSKSYILHTLNCLFYLNR